MILLGSGIKRNGVAAVLYGALFILVVRLIHTVAGDVPEPFFPPLNALGIAEFIGYLIPALLFS